MSTDKEYHRLYRLQNKDQLNAKARKRYAESGGEVNARAKARICAAREAVRVRVLDAFRAEVLRERRELNQPIDANE